MDDSIQKEYGKLIVHGEHILLVMGNCLGRNGTIWCAEYATGIQCDVLPAQLDLLPDGDQPPWEKVLGVVADWARQGKAHAMWWLAWAYEGTEYHRSLWYYLAAFRIEPTYRHLWSRVRCDARDPAMCEGVPAPDTSLLDDVPEFNGASEWGDWREAIANAEQVNPLEPTI